MRNVANANGCMYSCGRCAPALAITSSQVWLQVRQVSPLFNGEDTHVGSEFLKGFLRTMPSAIERNVKALKKQEVQTTVLSIFYARKKKSNQNQTILCMLFLYVVYGNNRIVLKITVTMTY